MQGFLTLGFLVGMQHALEADHIAAVSALATGGGSSRRGLALRGLAWGLGHTITLFSICTAVIVLGLNLTGQATAALEFAVGVMLVLLGLDVFRRMRRKRIHFHAHNHGVGGMHIHAHSHADTTIPHGTDPHCHNHSQGLPLRALAVGLVHGAAGSAGLLALAVAATHDALTAVGYVVVFGFGSLVGMGALTAAAAWPLGAAEKYAKWLYSGLSLGAAVLAVAIGINVMAANAETAWGAL